VAKQNYFFLVEFMEQKRRDFDSILRHSFNRHGRPDRARSAESSARTALIPLHDGKVFSPAEAHSSRVWAGRYARSAMQQKQDRVITILAANTNPLVDSADVDKQFLVDSSRKIYGSCARDMVLSVTAVRESNSDQNDNQSENAQQETFGNLPDFLPHVNAPYRGIT
jgi:hypothetical protein